MTSTTNRENDETKKKVVMPTTPDEAIDHFYHEKNIKCLIGLTNALINSHFNGENATFCIMDIVNRSSGHKVDSHDLELRSESSKRVLAEHVVKEHFQKDWEVKIDDTVDANKTLCFRRKKTMR